MNNLRENKQPKMVNNAILIANIPVEDRCYGLCFDAVKNDAHAIRYVPVENIDDEILDMVFDAGRDCIKLIPKEGLTDMATTKIKFRYPDIGIEMGLIPMQLDTATNMAYIEENYMNFLIIRGEHCLEHIPTKYYSPQSIELLKINYPEYCLEHGLIDVDFNYKSALIYQEMKKIVG